MAQIPITADVAKAVGHFGERVENRSLLLDKFVFHKSWPVENDERGRPVKWDDASRWSFMRIADQSQQLLINEQKTLNQGARGRNISLENKKKKTAQAIIARQLANVRWDSKELEELRASHTRNFVLMLKKTMPENHITVIGQLEGRMAINLSDSLIQNAGIALDRLFGMPYIPGSAIKGVCRHAAINEIKSINDPAELKKVFQVFQQVFGTTESDFRQDKQLHKFVDILSGSDAKTLKGRVDFLAAHPITGAKITVDLTTAHYPDYYRTGILSDLSKESPRPIPFPVVDKGARFAFCLVTNRADSNSKVLLDAAQRWLEIALTKSGLGAKTSSGYGWFSIPVDGLAKIEEAEKQKRERVELERQRNAEQAKEAEEANRAKEAEELRIQQKRAEEERRKNMSPSEIADEEVQQWNDDAFHARLRNFIKTKGAPDEEIKKAMVRAMHNNKAHLWNAFKQKAVRGNDAKIADAIRTISRNMNMGKMP
jgi:CRISPR-associated protein Cmr6